VTDPMTDEAAPSEPGEGARRRPRVHRSTLPCETCGRPTPHRILRVDPGRGGGATVVRGTARCQECGWTHRFESERPRTVEVALIESVGRESVRSRVELPGRSRVEVGTGLPGIDRPLLVQRLDDRSGRRVTAARTEEIATVWVVRDVGAIVPVSIVTGRITRAARLILPRETPLAVGNRVTVDRLRLEIAALRARGRTWRRPGDAFPAGEVQRLYARRISIPPAGRSAWSRDRGSPSSFDSSTSRSARARSSPGTRRNRIVPRERTADGGATVHRSTAS